MLVYSATIWLENQATPDDVLKAVAAWLTRKTRSEVAAESLKADGSKRMPDGSRVEIIRSDSIWPFLQCIRFTHGDKDVRGRQWDTEVGIRQENADSEIECSVLLKTEEISTRVDAKIQPTVPGVVHEIMKQCLPSPRTAGLSIATLDNDTEAEAFGYAIDYPGRTHPFIIISPTQTGEYLVNIDRLQFFVEGIAEIVQIPTSADTFRIGKLIGDQYIVWGGAVNIVFPVAHLRGESFIPTKRLMPDDLQRLVDDGIEPEREILSIIAHRVNLPNSWRHISLEKVAEQVQKDERKRLREQASKTGETVEYVAYIENYNSDLEQKYERLKGELSYLEALSLQIDDENRQLKHEIEGLKSSLFHVADKNAEETLPVYVQQILCACSKYMTPRESLLAISKIFPNRLEILDSAWKSSDESENFKEKKKVFDLLWTLTTEYWNALAAGKGDAEARNVFGKNTYAAKESEVAENNQHARQLRTFKYKGQDIEMMKHLKIGIKPSPSETIRIHFEWDAIERKIVVGYCGPHLDHK